jgi:hypothetical protein
MQSSCLLTDVWGYRLAVGDGTQQPLTIHTSQHLRARAQTRLYDNWRNLNKHAVYYDSEHLLQGVPVGRCVSKPHGHSTQPCHRIVLSWWYSSSSLSLPYGHDLYNVYWTNILYRVRGRRTHQVPRPEQVTYIRIDGPTHTFRKVELYAVYLGYARLIRMLLVRSFGRTLPTISKLLLISHQDQESMKQVSKPHILLTISQRPLWALCVMVTTCHLGSGLVLDYTYW